MSARGPPEIVADVIRACNNLCIIFTDEMKVQSCGSLVEKGFLPAGDVHTAVTWLRGTVVPMLGDFVSQATKGPWALLESAFTACLDMADAYTNGAVDCAVAGPLAMVKASRSTKRGFTASV
jgi:hypothetical protein